MKFMLFVMVASLSSYANVPAPKLDHVSAAPKDEIYVGCRPSAGECKNSCPNRNGKAKIMPELCDPKNKAERFACFCQSQD